MSEKFKVFINRFRQKISHRPAGVSHQRTPANCALSRRSLLIRDCDGAKQNFQKKNFLMMAFAVLFIAVSVSIPVHQAQAGWFAAGFAEVINSIVATANFLTEPFKFILWLILIIVLNLLLNLSTIAVNMGAWFVDAALDPRLYAVLTSSTVKTGWTVVRDMCNTFYVFFLLIIAFGTILRSSTFNAKNLLPKLVISLFLINFSAEITKLVIDFGQVFMYGIMSWMGTFQAGGSTLTSIVDRFNNLINYNWDITFSKVILIASALAYSLILAIIYVMLACFLMVRLVAFIFLIILSPIAFLSIVMPSMGKYTSEWWGELVKYSIFGPIFMFFVYLSATMANEMVGTYDVRASIPSTGWGFNSVKDTVVTVFPSIIPIMMLLYVIPITQKLGVSGAGKIIGGRLGLGNIVMGGYSGAKKTLGVGKWAGGKVTERSTRAAGAVGRANEIKQTIIAKIPGFGKGMALADKAGEQKAKQDKIDKRVDKYGGNLKAIDVELIMKGDDVDKAVGLKAAAAQGKLGDRDEHGNSKYEKHFTTAQEHFSNKDIVELTDKNLTMATMTKEGKKKISEASSGNYASFSDETAEKIKSNKITAEEGVKRDKMADIIRDGKAHEVQDLDTASSAKMWDDAQDPDQKKSAISRMAKDQRGRLSKGYMENVMDPLKYSNRVTMARVGRPEQKKEAKDKLEKDVEFKINAVNLGKDLEDVFKKGGGDVEKNIEDAFGRFDSKVVGKFSDKQLEKYAHKTTAPQWRELNRANKTEQFKMVLEAKERKKSGLTPSTTPGSEYVILSEQIKKMNSLLTGEQY